jgi:hypothetical protein
VLIKNAPDLMGLRKREEVIDVFNVLVSNFIVIFGTLTTK